MPVVTDLRGPVNGTTVYINGNLVARNTTITLPEITHVTATVKAALGEHEVPLFGLVEAMEATIQKIGVDAGLAKALTMENKTYEFRWAQQVTPINGSDRLEGCKVFIRGIPKVAAPSFELNPGDSVEVDIPLSVTRYQLFIDGNEVLMVDKLSGICRINGEDCANRLNSLL